MKVLLWKSDALRCEVRQVEAEPFPGSDVEGAKVYENTHFNTRSEALKRLLEDAEAMVCLTGQLVERLRTDLRHANESAADAAVRFKTVTDYVRRLGGVA